MKYLLFLIVLSSNYSFGQSGKKLEFKDIRWSFEIPNNFSIVDSGALSSGENPENKIVTISKGGKATFLSHFLPERKLNSDDWELSDSSYKESWLKRISSKASRKPEVSNDTTSYSGVKFKILKVDFYPENVHMYYLSGFHNHNYIYINFIFYNSADWNAIEKMLQNSVFY